MISLLRLSLTVGNQESKLKSVMIWAQLKNKWQRKYDTMEKKNIDWANLGFSYQQTDKRYVANYKDGAWDEGGLVEDPMITMSECACVLQ